MSITSGPAVPARTGSSKSLPSMVSLAVVLLSPMGISLLKPTPAWRQGLLIAFGLSRRLTALAGGVGQPGDGFFPPEHNHHVKHARCDAAACQSGPQGSGKLAELHIPGFGKLHGYRLQFVARPTSILQMRRQFFQYTTGYIIELRGGFLIRRNWPVGKNKLCLFNEFGECLG